MNVCLKNEMLALVQVKNHQCSYQSQCIALRYQKLIQTNSILAESSHASSAAHLAVVHGFIN